MITKEDQAALDEIRKISSIIASWIEVRLKAGMSWTEIDDRLQSLQAITCLQALRTRSS